MPNAAALEHCAVVALVVEAHHAGHAQVVEQRHVLLRHQGLQVSGDLAALRQGPAEGQQLVGDDPAQVAVLWDDNRMIG